MATQLHPEIIPNLPLPIPPVPPPAPVTAKHGKPRKKLIRRTDRDYSQQLRRIFQGLFLAWNAYLGTIFFLWVRQFEMGYQATLTRPAGVEGYLPIAGMMNLKYWLATGHVPAVHPAAMILLLAFLAITFLFRKAFCSWLCPVGTISEYLWRVGKKILKRNFHLPRWVDVPLRGLKYLLLGFFVWAVTSMAAPAIENFMRSPYGVIADVKMLNFFRYLGETGAIVLGILVLASVFVQNFWCRYLCPYGALMGLTAVLSPSRIRRNPDACIDCAKCAKACPSALPVDKLVTIKSAECTGCLECVAVCPVQGALQMSAWRQVTGSAKAPRAIPAWAMAAGIAVLFFGIVGFAKATKAWQTEIPNPVYQQLVPNANATSHPMPGDPGLQN
jgi:polyferredoxin